MPERGRELPRVFGGLPRKVADIDRVEWLVGDEGSTDASVEVARPEGAAHIVSLPNNEGSLRPFRLKSRWPRPPQCSSGPSS